MASTLDTSSTTTINERAAIDPAVSYREAIALKQTGEFLRAVALLDRLAADITARLVLDAAQARDRNDCLPFRTDPASIEPGQIECDEERAGVSTNPPVASTLDASSTTTINERAAIDPAVSYREAIALKQTGEFLRAVALLDRLAADITARLVLDAAQARDRNDCLPFRTDPASIEPGQIECDEERAGVSTNPPMASTLDTSSTTTINERAAIDPAVSYREAIDSSNHEPFARTSKKIRHAVLALVLIPSCFFLADLVSIYVSHALLHVTPSDPSTDSVTSSPVGQPPSPDAKQMVKTILSSGIFVVPTSVLALDPDAKATAPPPPPIELAGKLKLLGTAIRDGGRPSAAIESLQDHKQALYFLQDTIEGFGQLTAIVREGVTVRQGNRQGFLPFADASVEMVPITTAASVTGKPAAPPTMIDRRQLNQNLADVSKLMTEARAMPYYDLTNNGKLEGWQVIEIKPKSVLDLLGIQQRDVLLRINGTPVVDPGTMLRLLQEIQYSGKVVKVDLIRGGERQTLAYEVR